MVSMSKLLSGITLLVIVFIVTPAIACFTIVVGKDVSATGCVVVGHNEDNHRRIVMAQHNVPRIKHAPGTMITMEPTAAKIPQVGETWAYFWTQTMDPNGASFSDSFINEWGVSVVSNSSNGSNEKNPAINEGGVGYGIRRLIAERATSAREAVTIAADLVNTYGYTGAGRSYEISDGKEVWMMQIVKGNHFVAKRIADNEVAIIPNEFTIRNVDLKDKAHVVASPDIVEYAIKQGWYKPAKDGDYSDFDFARAYQADSAKTDAYNAPRYKTALKVLTGKDYTDPLNFPFSIIPNKKLTLDDVKAVLRSHTPGEAGSDNDFYHHNMYDVCNMSTHESVIVQQNPNPKLITMWRVSGRPCSGPFIPWFPLAAVPSGYNWMDPAAAQRIQFAPPMEAFDFDPARPWWVFLKLQALVNFQYPAAAKDMKKAIQSLEKNWAANHAQVSAKAEKLLKADENKGLEYLSAYSNKQAALAEAAVKKEIRNLEKYTMKIQAGSLSTSDNGRVDVVLYSKKGFDATKLDTQNTTLGVSYSKGRTGPDAVQAKPVALAAKDMNGDGIADAVLTFTPSQAATIGMPGVKTDLYLRTYVNKARVVATDTVLIVK